LSQSSMMSNQPRFAWLRPIAMVIGFPLLAQIEQSDKNAKKQDLNVTTIDSRIFTKYQAGQLFSKPSIAT
ncbi:MAG: hypothetical protein AAF974_13075, partial [Cyanobacteria bacterium P01_E01_bin.34]